jgi:hypothetical protein
VIALVWSQRARGGGRDPQAGVGVDKQPQNSPGSDSVREERLARQPGGELEVGMITGSMATRDDRRDPRICLRLTYPIVLRMAAALAVGEAVARLGEEDPKRHQEREEDGWKARGSQVPHECKHNGKHGERERRGRGQATGVGWVSTHGLGVVPNLNAP